MPERELSLAESVERDLVAQTVPAAAAELKKKWLKIGALLSFHGEPPVELPEPKNEKNPTGVSDEDITRYTNEFMETGSANMTLKNGSKKQIKLSEIDAAIGLYNASNNPNDPDYPPMSSELPSRRTLAKTAEATARGAESQSGFGSMIMNFLAGLMNWFSGLFSGDKNAPTFWEAVGNAAAPKVGNAVALELQKEASNDPAVARYLQHNLGGGVSVADSIVGGAMDKTKEKATGVAPPASLPLPATAKLTDIQPEKVGLQTNEEIKKQVYDGIINKESGVHTSAFDALKKISDQKYAESWASTFGVFKPSDAEIALNADKATRLIADTVSESIAKDGARLSTLSKDDFAKEMAGNIIARAEKEKESRGLPDLMFTADPTTKTRPIDALRPELEKSLEAQHQRLHPAMKVVEKNGQETLAEIARSEPKATSQDITTTPANGFVPTPGIPSPSAERGIA